ncbi:DNA-directed RNA polymerase subunit beta [Paenibacillus chibensis]|nr:DNA-directed RNA polymerase subunit beta [Paenibacillus chibensis]MEC0373007.1 DNA-directed RNA polymerase subunit beta [Paenibacillus chibensis]
MDRDHDDKPAHRRTARWRIVIRWMIPLFLVLALIGGMAFGYVFIGKQSLSDVFEWKTWQHVIDLVFAP